jgi:molybdopterin biosynthesis enzyme
MQGARDCDLKKGFALTGEKIKGAKERDAVLPVSLKTDENGKLFIESLRFRGSSNFIAFARADALVFVPQGAILEAGTIARIAYLP